MIRIYNAINVFLRNSQENIQEQYKIKRQIQCQKCKQIQPQNKQEKQFQIICLKKVRLVFQFLYFSLLHYLPIWILYDFLLGTVAMGLWALGHECCHNGFSDNKLLNDFLGYLLHEIFLVPYYSWQHSHFLHHAKTNHLFKGETFCPIILESKIGKVYQKVKAIIGDEAFAFFQIFNITIIGWPLYLLFGATAGSARGFTSHFIIPNKLLPSKMLFKVSISNIGNWAQNTSFAQVMSLYIGPYLVVNMWLTIVTFIQHTDISQPNYDDRSWNWLKGALGTFDRNYPLWIDSLQYEIGSTHALHHIFGDIPHYHAKEANIYFKKAIGKYYKVDNESFIKRLYECAQLVGVEHKGNGIWMFSKQ